MHRTPKIYGKSTTGHSQAQALQELFAKWQIKNEDTAKWYGVAIGLLVCIFIFAHWSGIALDAGSRRCPRLASVIRRIATPVRRFFGQRTVLGISIFPATILVCIIYFAINIALTFYDDALSVKGNGMFAKRLGWMALLNMCITIFLGLKNTPLSPLAGRTYRDLNIFHRCCGYTTILYVVLHACIYPAALFYNHAEEVLLESPQYAGYTAGVAMVLIFLTANPLVRKRQYEVFYFAHIVLVVVILITVGLHRPDLSLKALIVTLLAASLWFADRLLRITRFSISTVGNNCTLAPLAEGVTKVTLHRPIFGAHAGQHAFLCMPGVRALEAHPFTIISTNPVQFLVKGRNGFTHNLYEAAHATAACARGLPEQKFRVLVEGPYGPAHVVNDSKYDRVLLFAGGSGVTFTLALAMEWARNCRAERSTSSLDFVWVVRNSASFSWFESELTKLSAHSRVNVYLYVTGPSSTRSSSESDISRPSKLSSRAENTTLTTTDEKRNVFVENFGAAYGASRNHLRGRPDVHEHLYRSMEGLASDARMFVGGCGPTELLSAIRTTATGCPVSGTPDINLCLEEFTY